MSKITDKVLVEMKNGETFTIELYPQYAPKTVANFQKLVSEGFYNGLTFHRVIDDFMAQGGCPKGNGTGGSGENIPGEFIQNGFADNTLSHTRGVVSMARAMNPDSASSQFFICYTDVPFLDGQYAAFGKVIDGMETVDNFLNTKRLGPEGGTPVSPIIIQRMSFTD
ncbi:MAG: peptidylprolyl isomerase [Clostridiales bacterium]|nr:peptidylprolyl isomerase [Clostridiales bacterium]